MKKIFLSNGQVSLVSDIDHIFLAGFYWSINGSINSSGYATAWVDGKTQLMHRIIAKRMKLDLKDKEVDHINNNKLDNRRENLRAATRSQNNMNRISMNNMSGYKGVSWHKKKQKWFARIYVDQQQIHLGYFNTPKAAHQAYIAAAKQFYGEFAKDTSRAS